MPHGTVVHPSVYFLLFEHATALVPLDTRESELQKRLIAIEMRMLGTVDKHLIIDHGFWTGDTTARPGVPDQRWPVRVLVCGNTGVGKSTLINKVFGVPVVGAMNFAELRHALTITLGKAISSYCWSPQHLGRTYMGRSTRSYRPRLMWLRSWRGTGNGVSRALSCRNVAKGRAERSTTHHLV